MIDWVWVQEEPINMGAWTYVKDVLALDNLEVVARKPSASPATGFKSVHDQKQADIVNRAFL
jgi:2-oxoglutarate dehydrogenase E1 component